MPEGFLKIGMIGAGIVGQTAHLANFTTMKNCRVVALAELRPTLAAAVGAQFGIARLYQNHRELLEDPEIDAVIVATRRPATGPIVQDAFQARKHVLSEKPMAHTVAQAVGLVRAAEAAGCLYAVGFMKRHDLGYQQGKQRFIELCQSRDYGCPLLIRVFNYNGNFAPGNHGFAMSDEARPEGLELWPVAPEFIPRDKWEDYSWFVNVFSHSINLLRDFTEVEPEVVHVDLSRKNGRLIQLACSGVPCILELVESKNISWHEGIEVIFEQARLTIFMPPPLLRQAAAEVVFTDGPSGMVSRWQDKTGSWAFRRQAENFVDSIIRKNMPVASGQDAVSDLALIEKIWQCSLGQ